MKTLNFRTLTAGEIDCRIATVKESGISLLLYKDARVDQNILDEVVGPMNWSRSHQLIGDRLYCTVSIRDGETGEWVAKQDVGTESYTEKEKGQASDSFKRACFNWGIGRELYTAPFIWIGRTDCSIQEAVDSRGQKRYTCYDSFHVAQIGYDENRNINALVIKKDKGGKVVYTLGQKQPAKAESPVPSTSDPGRITQAQIKTLLETGKKKKVNRASICATFGVKTMEEMTTEQFKECMSRFQGLPDQE